MHRVGVVGAAVLASLLALPAAVGQEEGPEIDPANVRSQAAVRPVLQEVDTDVLVPVDQGLLPQTAALRTQVEQEWDDPYLGPARSRSLVIQDVLTGQTLLDLRGDQPRVPASTTKLLTAAAVLTTMDPQERLSTQVVAGEGPDELVLVAGGDLLLSPGEGHPDAVVGRAGLADLAEQTAAALAARRAEGDSTSPTAAASGPLRLRLDTTYAAGSSVAPGWSDYWVDNGFAGRITMLGLEGDRALPFQPSPTDPPMAAAEGFREALTEAGVEVAEAPITRIEVAAPDPEVLARVQSAPVGEVLALALSTSDNAMVEQLARQAAVRDGIPTDQAAVNAWVLDQVAGAYGVDVSGARLADTSGLSDGTRIPMRVVSEVLVAGADGSHPALASVLRGLPVAGWSGTLFDRFLLESATQGRGIVRAKTGSLPGVTALAGTLVTADDRLLAFALAATDIGEGPEAIEARALVDAMLADLAGCGC